MNDPRRTRPFSLQNLIPYPDGVADTVIKMEGEPLQEFDRCPPTFTRPLVKALNAAYCRGAQDGMDRVLTEVPAGDVARARQLQLTDDSQFFLSVKEDSYMGKTRMVTGAIKHSIDTDPVMTFGDFRAIDEIRQCIKHFELAYGSGLKAGTEFAEVSQAISLAVS